ncbi:MAG: ribonuclease P component 1 family protein [Candidatus Woesearchaeota archaeon]
MKKIPSFAQCFIGKRIKVMDSPCKSLMGMEGKIVDETKFTFKVDTQDSRKQLHKNQIVFIINNKNELIDGKKIMKQPSERLKLRIKND